MVLYTGKADKKNKSGQRAIKVLRGLHRLIDERALFLSPPYSLSLSLVEGRGVNLY